MKFACLLWLALALAPLAARATSVDGDWLTAKGGAAIRLAPCGQDLCGTIVWLKEPNDEATGRPATDSANPDPALRGRPILGLRILTGLEPDGPGHWRHGRIYDAQSGRSYRANLTMNADGALTMQGCLAIFCRSQRWTRTSLGGPQ